MALLKIQDNSSTVIDNNEFPICIFLDIAKAFDTLDHGILFAKLENIGIRGINVGSRAILHIDNNLLCARGAYLN